MVGSQMKLMDIVPVGKYVNSCGEEGIRYVWDLNQEGVPYVESGAFIRRTKLGGTEDDSVAAYTTSVSRGCVLGGELAAACAFCVTGNVIGYKSTLSDKQIALQNVFMALDDAQANAKGQSREFAYMGQGEPGFAYPSVSSAIKGTNKVMDDLGIKVYRHIFATVGVPSAIRQLARDVESGNYSSTILLHLSVHSVTQRDQIMPINLRFPLEEIMEAANEYSRLTGQKAVVNFMLFKDALISGRSGVSTATISEVEALVKLLNPAYQRVVLCEYNPDPRIGSNNELTPTDVESLEKILTREGLEHKKFIAFGRKDNLACGLLGGSAEPNLRFEDIRSLLDWSIRLVNEFMHGD